MAQKRPLALYNGVIRELQVGDLLPTESIPSASSSLFGDGLEVVCSQLGDGITNTFTLSKNITGSLVFIDGILETDYIPIENSNQLVLGFVPADDELVVVYTSSVGTVVPVPTKPTVTSPSGTLVVLLPLITTSAFAIINDDDHIGSQYQIATDSNFTDIVYNTDKILDLVSHQLITPNYLEQSTTYYIRARHLAKIGGWSEWSDTVSFTTVNVYVNTPTISVTGSPLSIQETPTISGGSFSVINGSDTHLNSDWQIFESDGITLVWESLADAVNKENIVVPATYLVASTSYVFKVRYRGTVQGESLYSSMSGTTLASFGPTPILAVAHYDAPFLTIYSHSVDTFTKLADPSTLPTTPARAAAFSSDGTYLAVAHSISPFINIYKRSGDTFTKLADPSVLPTSIARAAAFSSDGTYLVVAHDVSPFITIYKRSGDTFTKLANPSTLPTNTGMAVAFYPSALYGA